MKASNRILITLSASLMLAPAALAQEERTGPSVREQVEQQLQVYRTELELSDYQWAQVEVILKSGIRERVAIARRYGLDGSGNRLEEMSSKDKRRMAKDLKNSRKETEDRMERYLDKDQMKAFKAFQEEQREQMLARLEERQVDTE